MAQRDENCLFTRRLADRGSDEIVFDSQDRKIQETDPKDVIWDEIVGKEEHPEDCDGYKFLETDSEAFIWDENCGKEEYPGNCSVIYPSPPCFDDYGDEEWYSWFTGGDRNLPGDESGSKSYPIAGGELQSVVAIGGETKLEAPLFLLSIAKPAVEVKSVSRLCHAKPIVTVNGMFPGPTVYAREGDRVLINVTNHAQYNMSIHWHGLKQYANGWADGQAYITQCPIKPGNNYVYDFTITGQRGTLWWHAHIFWLRATVYGAIVILPKQGTLFPFPRPDGEEVIVFGEWWHADVEEVVIIAQKIRVDFPFDPGGFVFKTKLEGEFFRRRGV